MNRQRLVEIRNRAFAMHDDHSIDATERERDLAAMLDEVCGALLDLDNDVRNVSGQISDARGE